MVTISAGASGNWSNPATWTGGIVPILGDRVLIGGGFTVTVDGTFSAGDDTSTAIIFGTIELL